MCVHCPATTWIYLTPYICTERIFDSRPFMYSKICLKFVFHISTLLLTPNKANIKHLFLDMEGHKHLNLFLIDKYLSGNKEKKRVNVFISVIYHFKYLLRSWNGPRSMTSFISDLPFSFLSIHHVQTLQKVHLLNLLLNGLKISEINLSKKLVN